MFPNKHILQMAAETVTAQGGVRDVPLNPLASPISAQISTQLVSPQEIAFHFRKDKDFEKANPSAVGKTKRQTFKMNVPLLTRAGLIAALQAGDKSTELALEKANEAIVDRLRGLINEKVDGDKFNLETGKYETSLAPDMFDLNQLSFLTIANLPKSERGSGIPKEAWAEFVADYKETMQKPEAVAMLPDKKPRSPEILEKHGVILGGKFNAVRSRKDVIQQMLGFLDVWVQASPNADEHLQCYEHLKAKGDALLQAENFDDL
jgi:hypothetical protein